MAGLPPAEGPVDDFSLDSAADGTSPAMTFESLLK
jgi:hypothetical protein